MSENENTQQDDFPLTASGSDAASPMRLAAELPRVTRLSRKVPAIVQIAGSGGSSMAERRCYRQVSRGLQLLACLSGRRGSGAGRLAPPTPSEATLPISSTSLELAMKAARPAPRSEPGKSEELL